MSRDRLERFFENIIYDIRMIFTSFSKSFWIRQWNTRNPNTCSTHGNFFNNLAFCTYLLVTTTVTITTKFNICGISSRLVQFFVQRLVWSLLDQSEGNRERCLPPNEFFLPKWKNFYFKILYSLNCVKNSYSLLRRWK